MSALSPVEQASPEANRVLPAQASSPPEIASGELLEARIYVLGIEAAAAHVVACPGQSADQVRMHLTARSTGLLAMVRDARMELDTTLSLETGLPSTDWSEVELGAKSRRYEVTFAPGRYGYRYERNYGPPRTGRVRSPDSGVVHDLHSAVVLMRTWRAEPRSSGTIFAVLGRHMWKTELEYVGPEVIAREHGPEPAARYDGYAEKIHSDPKQREKRRFKLWFSDDDARVPVRATSESSFGDIRMEMTRYERHGANEACAANGDVTTWATPSSSTADSPGVTDGTSLE